MRYEKTLTHPTGWLLSPFHRGVNREFVEFHDISHSEDHGHVATIMTPERWQED